MDIEKARMWSDALKSGRYAQGSGFLNVDNKEFCCLGVLCEVAMENGLPMKKNSVPYTHSMCRAKEGSVYWRYNGSYRFPPVDALVWLGMDPMLGHLFHDPLRRREYASEDQRLLEHLINMNDAGACSFIEIADTIDEALDRVS